MAKMAKNIKLREVSRLGEVASPLMTVETKEDMGVGLLVALDSDGKAILADNTTSSEDKYAVGFVYKTSCREWGAETELNREGILRKGEYLDLYTKCVIKAEELKGGKVGDLVYLGKAGKLTTTKPSGGTEHVQVVGVLRNPNTCAVEIDIRDKGEASV